MRNDYTPPICETPAAGANPETAVTHDAGLKVKVADELRVIRMSLVKAQLATDFAAAFDLAAYQLALSVFGPPRAADRDPTSLRITATADAPDGRPPHETDAFTAASPGVELLKTNAGDLDLEWLNAGGDRERFDAFRRLSLEARRNLFAAAVGRSVVPQLSFDPGARAETEAVIEALEIPFHSLYRPTLDGFWRQIGRREMLAIADGVLEQAWAEAHASDRKDALARALATAFGKETPPTEAGISPEARAGFAVDAGRIRAAAGGREPPRRRHHVRAGGRRRRRRAGRRRPRLDVDPAIPDRVDPTNVWTVSATRGPRPDDTSASPTTTRDAHESRRPGATPAHGPSACRHRRSPRSLTLRYGHGPRRSALGRTAPIRSKHRSFTGRFAASLFTRSGRTCNRPESVYT